MAAMNGNTKKPYLLMALTGVLLVVGLSGYLISGKTVEPKRFYLKNAGGAVMFEHEKHIGFTESCADCHHTILYADQRNDCSDCHGDDVSAEDFSHKDLMEVDAHHCTTCHLVNKESSPQACGNCHPKMQEAEQITLPCATCHDSSFEKDMLTHDEMQEIEAHTCDGCHQPQSVSEVYHEQCNRCHLEGASQRFVLDGGKIRCQACHLK
jgi:hypothetical protein